MLFAWKLLSNKLKGSSYFFRSTEVKALILVLKSIAFDLDIEPKFPTKHR